MSVSISERRSRRTAWLFLSPMLLVLLGVAGWPLGRTVVLSFTDASLSGFEQARWVGFDNYLALRPGHLAGVLADPDWWRSVTNTLLFATVSVGLETLLGLGVALILHGRFAGRGLVRAAVLVPWAIPTVVSAKIWGWMLHDQFGLINDLALRLGILDAPRAFTASPGLAMASIIAVDVWKTTPFMALLILAALQTVPEDVREAARVDGAGALQTFWRITLPLIRPAIVVAVVFRLLDALRVFDLIYVLTSGSRSTMSMSVYARRQLVDFQEVGYGSAASTLLFLVVSILTIAYLRLSRVNFDAARS